MRGPAFKGTPFSVGPYDPTISTPHIQYEGIPLGYELRTGKVIVFYPWKMPTASRVFSIEGEKDAGKSALEKSLGLRFLCLQARDFYGNPTLMRCRWHGRKSERGETELKPLADALYAPMYDLGQSTEINLFGLFWHEADIIEVAIMIAWEIKGAPLGHKVTKAIMIGVNKMMRLAPDKASPPLLRAFIRGLTQQDLADYHKEDQTYVEESLKDELEGNPEKGIPARPDLLKALDISFENTSAEEMFDQDFIDAKNEAADLYGQLLRGDYGRSFGARDNLYQILSSDDPQFLNWETMPIKARNLMDAVLLKAQASSIVRPRDGAPLDLSRIIPHANFKDEEASAAHSRIHLMFDADFVNKARAYVTADFRSLQYDIQVANVGKLDPALGYYADQIEAGIDTRFLFRHPDDDTFRHRLMTMRGFSDIEAAALTNPQLPPGQMAICVKGRKPLWCQYFLTAVEWPLVQTNYAPSTMSQGQPIWTERQLAEQVRKYGVIEIRQREEDINDAA